MKKEEIYTSKDVFMSKKYHDLHDIIGEFSARENIFNFKKKERKSFARFVFMDRFI